MIKKILSFNIVAAALIGSAVSAQDAATSDEAPAAENGSQLDLGETGPRLGEQYVKEETGDWQISCIKTDDEADPCAMRQLLNGQQGQPIAEITIQKLPEGNAAVAGATVIVPLETLLQAQLALSIDGAPRKLYDYHHCNPVGCLVQMGFAQGDVDAMKAGSTAVISLVPVVAPNQVLEMDVSLSGFTAGFDGLSVNTN